MLYRGIVWFVMVCYVMFSYVIYGMVCYVCCVMVCFLYVPLTFDIYFLFQCSTQPRVKLAEIALGTEGEALAKQINRVTGLQWAGFKQGSVYTGHLPDGMGIFMYQIDGQRFLAISDILELVEVAKPSMLKRLFDGQPISPEEATTTLQDTSGFTTGLVIAVLLLA